MVGYKSRDIINLAIDYKPAITGIVVLRDFSRRQYDNGIRILAWLWRWSGYLSSNPEFFVILPRQKNRKTDNSDYSDYAYYNFIPHI